MITARILPVTDTTTVDELIQAARASGMHLISNGFKVVLSPIVPPGFFKVAVKIKTDRRAILEPASCAT